MLLLLSFKQNLGDHDDLAANGGEGEQMHEEGMEPHEVPLPGGGEQVLGTPNDEVAAVEERFSPPNNALLEDFQGRYSPGQR